MADGYVRILLTIIAAALVVLVLLEGGWLPRRADAEASAPLPIGRYQYMATRYGPLGNFALRFDTVTGKLERVRFPASDVVWEEIGVLPPGKTPKPDPLRESMPMQPLTIGPGSLVLPGAQQQQQQQPAQQKVPPGGAAPR